MALERLGSIVLRPSLPRWCMSNSECLLGITSRCNDARLREGQPLTEAVQLAPLRGAALCRTLVSMRISNLAKLSLASLLLVLTAVNFAAAHSAVPAPDATLLHQCPWDSGQTVQTVVSTVSRCTASNDNPPNPGNIGTLSGKATGEAADVTVNLHSCGVECPHPFATTCFRSSSFGTTTGGSGFTAQDLQSSSNLGLGEGPCPGSRFYVTATFKANFIWQVTCNCDG